MPTPKTKPTQPTAEPKPALTYLQRLPATPKEIAAEEKRAIRQAACRERAKKLQHVREFLDLDEHQIEMIDTFRLIMSRVYVDQNGPVDKFITSLVHRYAWAEDRGEGLTVEDIESEVEDLRKDMAEDVSAAYFISDRYPRPEPKGADANHT